MKEELKNILTNLSPEEFSELTHSVSMGYNTRTKMRDSQISIEDIANKSGLTNEEVFNFLCGAHGYGFDYITKIEYALMALIDEKDGKRGMHDLLKINKKN